VIDSAQLLRQTSHMSKFEQILLAAVVGTSIFAVAFLTRSEPAVSAPLLAVGGFILGLPVRLGSGS